jgi:hypothetical protein
MSVDRERPEVTGRQSKQCFWPGADFLVAEIVRRRDVSALSSAATEPVFHFHFDRPAIVSKVATHFLAHGNTSFLRERDECLPGRAATLLERFEVGVK